MALTSKYWDGVKTPLKHNYTRQEIEDAYRRGYIDVFTYDRLLKEMLVANTDTGQMTVKPDKPVKPDKFHIPFEMQMLYQVDMLVGGDRQTLHLSWGGGERHDDKNPEFLTFESSGLYQHMTIDRHTYYYDVYPECRGPVSIKKEHIIMYSPIWVRVAEQEDINEGWKTARENRYARGF